MTTIANGLVCDVCSTRADNIIRFAATMQLPTSPIFKMPEESQPARISTNQPSLELAPLLPLFLHSKFTCVDMPLVYSAVLSFLEGKMVEDFPTPGYYFYEMTSRLDIIEILITELLGKPLGKRISLLYQDFQALPSFHLFEYRKGGGNLERRGPMQALLRLVPNAIDMITHGGSPALDNSLTSASEENSRWLCLYFRDILVAEVNTLAPFIMSVYQPGSFSG